MNSTNTYEVPAVRQALCRVPARCSQADLLSNQPPNSSVLPKTQVLPSFPCSPACPPSLPSIFLFSFLHSPFRSVIKHILICSPEIAFNIHGPPRFSGPREHRGRGLGHP